MLREVIATKERKKRKREKKNQEFCASVLFVAKFIVTSAFMD